MQSQEEKNVIYAILKFKTIAIFQINLNIKQLYFHCLPINTLLALINTLIECVFYTNKLILSLAKGKPLVLKG